MRRWWRAIDICAIDLPNRPLEKHRTSVWNVAIAPDGSFLASVGEDNTLVVWDLARILKLDLLEYGCNWVRDYLRTNAEVEEGDRQLCQ
ncbi:MAG: WD40 repeat domain-containing protein [Microcoleus sp.]